MTLTLLDHSLTVSPDWDHPMTWVYLAGERKNGKTIKIGKTTQATVRQRLKSVNGAQMNDEEYVLLAAVRGDGTAEKALHDYFKAYRQGRGSHTEYFDAEPALIEYVLWLRTQHFVSINDIDVEAQVLKEDRNHWIARPDRRVPAPPDDEHMLFSRHLQTQGGLAGTAWAWMPDPLASFQDYFTPPDLVRRAWDAMGGIDLDAASHFLANRDLWQAGVEIPDYYTAGRSAMDNPWGERVWLNPPYGENLEWFERIAHEMDVGHVQQLCMLSPMYSFNTKQALPYMARAEGMVVLSPTPKFKNPADPLKTGINHPHAIVYWGDRCQEFFAAFDGVGIPCQLLLEGGNMTVIGEDTGAADTADVTAPVVGAVWTVHGDVTQIAEPWVTALGELEEVARTHTANAGTYSYTYADLGDVLGQSRPVLARHGLALFQVPTVADGEVSMATVVMHVSGTWLEFAPLCLPAGPTAQSTGSAATYGRRYSVMSILGLATEDNDGQTAGVRPPPKLSRENVDRFFTAAHDALLTSEETEFVVLDATEGRTANPAEVYVSEVAALRDALARASQPKPVDDAADAEWVQAALEEPEDPGA